MSDKHEPVFDLIAGMSKAEKRNFKLYATRLSGNQEAKFLQLFDCLDSIDEYDEAKVLQRCPVKKEQLPNMKAHLYRQILVSIRMLNVQHSEAMQFREQLDFAEILFDKGLYRQSDRMLDKLIERAFEMEEYSIALDAVELRARVDRMNLTTDMAQVSDTTNRQIKELSSRVETVSELSDITTRAMWLYQQLGYARTQKDLDLIEMYFRPRIDTYDPAQMSFHELFHYYQAMAWYYYIRHEFVKAYRYSRLWLNLFEANPRMKSAMYDSYLRGYSQILDSLYLMRKYRQFGETLSRLEDELAELSQLNTNAELIGRKILYVNRINRHFIEGEFKQGLLMVREVEFFIRKYSKHLDLQFKMMMYFKIACLYFGDGNYNKCIEYLSRINSTRDPQIRRDLQCFARMLNLIASYEAGIDYNMDYQIRSVYAFLVKMNDMGAVQKEMLSFLKKLNSIYADDVKNELNVLYKRLKPYEDHPYERRAFYYLDVLSWLESKMTGKSMSEILKRKSGNNSHPRK